MTTTPANLFGSLEKVRVAAGLTVIEMAAIMQVSRQTYYAWIKPSSNDNFVNNQVKRAENIKRVRATLWTMVGLMRNGHDFTQTKAATREERAEELLAMLGIGA
jgi:DNA-binding XRE family transcriptional regulator